MATGKIVIIKEGDRGLFGYVCDDAVKSYDPTLNVYFDSRCFANSEAIGLGDHVEFSYDLNNRASKPRMRFDSMRLI